MTDFPKFPRHLSQDERRAVLESAARAHAKEAIAEMARVLGAPEAELRSKGWESQFQFHGVMLVKQQWAAERIEALEAEVRAGYERIKALEDQSRTTATKDKRGAAAQ